VNAASNGHRVGAKVAEEAYSGPRQLGGGALYLLKRDPSDRDHGLDKAVAGALSANRLSRIEWRDAIAANGPAGIDAVFEWGADSELGFFAVRVIEAVGKLGWTDEALDALVSLRAIGASDSVRAEAEAAMQRLRPGAGQHVVFRKKRPAPANGGIDWPGFQVSDFGNIKGTTWRMSSDRRGLVPLLLRPLQDLDDDFRSYPIYPVPEVHLANRDRYEQGGEHAQGWRASKLVIYAHDRTDGAGARVVVGYYVERGTGSDEFGPVERALWDWPRFLDVLRDPARRAPLEAAFEAHDLRIGDYLGGRFRPEGAFLGFLGRLEDGQLIIRRDGVEIGQGWIDLLEILDGLPPDHWYDLHIWRSWPSEDAINVGHPFAVSVMLPVLLDLARLYESVITFARSPKSVRTRPSA
jgi:hypothetical protein